jgi:glycosyltransferase involved in cell wall biosynthesis
MVEDCLHSLLTQSAQPDEYEVIVIDDGSTDGTAEAVESARSIGLESVRYIRQDHAGLSAARNRAVDEARTDLICFIDDDALASNVWVEEIAAGARRHPDVDCFVGPVILRLEGRPPRNCGCAYSASQFDAGEEERESPKIMGGNMFIRRRAFECVGPFNPTLVWRGDEDEWFRRVKTSGGTAVYLPKAAIWHRRTERELRPWTLLKTKFGWGVAQVQYKRAAGVRFSYLDELRGIIRSLLHAVRRGCFGGIVSATVHLGAIWTSSASRRRGHKRARVEKTQVESS